MKEQTASSSHSQAGTGVRYPCGTLPILNRCDVVVAGGSFAGVAAALAFARDGRKVTLVEPRTYLGREITATLRPWIAVDESAGVDGLPELIAVCADASGAPACSGEIPLKLDAETLS